MNEKIVSSTVQSEALTSRTFVRGSSLPIGGTDFKTLLANLYQKPVNFMQEYAGPDKGITIEGYGTFEDKSTPAVQMAAAYWLNMIETQLTTCLSYAEYLFKTLPQKMDSML
jgi:hypothetical protein